MGEQVIASCYAVCFLFILFIFNVQMYECMCLTKELQLEVTKSNPSKNEVSGINLADNLAHILMGILSGCKLHLTFNA
jgi:hypothetical protein